MVRHSAAVDYDETEAALFGKAGNMIRVLVVDDHPLVRVGVTAVLNAAAVIGVVGDCSDGAQVVQVAGVLWPDVVLMDVLMPVKSGIEATRELMKSQPAVRVLMLTGLMKEEFVHSVAAGAVGYILKGDPDRLVDAVRYAASGGTLWPGESLFREAANRPIRQPARGRWSVSAVSSGSGESVNPGWCPQTREQFTLFVGSDVDGVAVADVGGRSTEH